jgi:threonine/homoserine/homoserine lactone efflux protein
MSFPLEPRLLLAFTLTGLALNVTPGPDMLFVLGSGMSGGRTAGLRAALGIGAGGCVHTVAAAIGLSALLAQSAALFSLVKLAGATYLLYLGVRAIVRPGVPGALAERASEPTPARKVFRRAVVTNVLNPKVALFFLALVPQFVTAERGHIALQFVLLGMMFNTTGTCVNALVGVFAGQVGERLARSERLRRALDRATGAIFIGLGMRLALAKQVGAR